MLRANPNKRRWGESIQDADTVCHMTTTATPPAGCREEQQQELPSACVAQEVGGSEGEGRGEEGGMALRAPVTKLVGLASEDMFRVIASFL